MSLREDQYVYYRLTNTEYGHHEQIRLLLCIHRQDKTRNAHTRSCARVWNSAGESESGSRRRQAVALMRAMELAMGVSEDTVGRTGSGRTKATEVNRSPSPNAFDRRGSLCAWWCG